MMNPHWQIFEKIEMPQFDATIDIIANLKNNEFFEKSQATFVMKELKKKRPDANYYLRRIC